MTPERATRYRIVALDPHAHLFEVSCTIDDPDPDGQPFRLPSWIPGSYMIREFARQFVRVHAESAGRTIAIDKVAKDLWRAAPCAGPLTVVAHVYAYELSVRSAYLDATRAYINGPSVFLCPEGRAGEPCEVEIVAPDGAAYRNWRVATTLSHAGAQPWGFGRYRAADYDELIDHPVEMADFARASFNAGGVPHDIVVTGRIDADLERLACDLARICQWQVSLFDDAGLAPFERYLFQVAAVGEGHGGLEHRASTSLLCKRDELPARGAGKVNDDYRNFLGLASHEYFHCWNVKRIKPAAFVPYALDRESYTRQLWAFEGVTSYYDDLALLKSGVVGVESYLELVGRTITTVLRTPGRHLQSVADSSFDAWIKFYRQDDNAPNAIVSYYAKGSLVALALDLTLRQRGCSLDALMRVLWRRYGQTGIGVPEDGIEAIAKELGGAELSQFFAGYVYGTEDPPLETLLAHFGVSMHLRSALGPRDRGGTAGPADEGDSPRCWLGTRLTDGGGTKLQHVYSAGPAEHAGLAAGDELAAIDGVRASIESIDSALQRHRPGETLTIHAFRRDELIETTLTLAEAPRDVCWLAPSPEPDADTRARRSAWLGADR